MFSTLKELDQVFRRPDTTLSELLSFPLTTQRSPISSANAGLNDSAPLGRFKTQSNHRAATRFGPHAGYAQQYLFHYMRTKLK